MKRKQKIPKALTAEEQTKLLGAIKPRRPLEVRDLCMVRLMLNAGLRASELLALRIDHINWETGHLMVINGKGGKDRGLWLADEDLDLLTKWLQVRLKNSDNPLIFTNQQGKPIKTRRLRALVKNWGAKAGVPQAHPHMLRHSFATDLFRMTNSLPLVQDALGHESIYTTRIYLTVHNPELEAAMKELRNGKGKDHGRGVPQDTGTSVLDQGRVRRGPGHLQENRRGV